MVHDAGTMSKRLCYNNDIQAKVTLTNCKELGSPDTTNCDESSLLIQLVSIIPIFRIFQIFFCEKVNFTLSKSQNHVRRPMVAHVMSKQHRQSRFKKYSKWDFPNISKSNFSPASLFWIYSYFQKTLKSKTMNLTWYAYQALSMYRPAHAVERSLIENDTYYNVVQNQIIAD